MIFIYGAGSPYSQECCWSLLNEYLDLRKQEENSAFLKIIELKLDVDTFCYDDIFAFINRQEICPFADGNICTDMVKISVK